MKLTGIFALFALALPAVAVPVHDHTMGYDGIKVLRIPTGNSTAKLNRFVEDLDLDIWTHSVRPNSHIDVEVPKDKFQSFTTSINKLLTEEGITTPVEVMHEDLGASIRKEAEGIATSNSLSRLGMFWSDPSILRARADCFL